MNIDQGLGKMATQRWMTRQDDIRSQEFAVPVWLLVLVYLQTAARERPANSERSMIVMSPNRGSSTS